MKLRRLMGGDSPSVVRRAMIVCAAAFLFCFSLVPVYRIACEKVFGTRVVDRAADAGKLGAMAVDSARWITVEFDGNVNTALAWSFAPKATSMRVHPGELSEAWFSATNLSEQALVGQAVPSIAPKLATLYFNKTECFCFTQQMLKPGETRAMPVRFVVDPKLPPDVTTVTLSYTFYLNDIATRQVAVADAGKAPAT
jgi:cytochrome c oxidase assembly protein subunit 11